MIKEAVVLAGGFGTRLRPVISDLPKPLAPVNGHPFLHYVFVHLKNHGIRKVVLSVGYMHEKIQSHFGKEYLGLEVAYAIEHEPLGTGGGIRLAMEQCTDAHVLAMNGDTLFKVPLTALFEAHMSGSADATLALRKVEDGSRYGTIDLDGKRITAFREKSPDRTGPQWINGGVYAMRRKTFMKNTESGKAFSIEHDFFGKYSDRLLLHAFPTDAYFIDIGIPEDYARAQTEFNDSMI